MHNKIKLVNEIYLTLLVTNDNKWSGMSNLYKYNQALSRTRKIFATKIQKYPDINNGSVNAGACEWSV